VGLEFSLKHGRPVDPRFLAPPMQEDSIRSAGPVPGVERVGRLAALIAAGLQMRAMGLPRVCNRNTATLLVIIGFLGIFKASARAADTTRGGVGGVGGVG
jgi:hypothetical protein